MDGWLKRDKGQNVHLVPRKGQTDTVVDGISPLRPPGFETCLASRTVPCASLPCGACTLERPAHAVVAEAPKVIVSVQLELGDLSGGVVLELTYQTRHGSAHCIVVVTEACERPSD